MKTLVVLAALGAGAGGALLRYAASLTFARQPQRLPWAVLLVNVVGSAIGGFALGLAAAGVMGPDGRLILLGGLAGGLTTFSTFSVETIQLVRDGRRRAAVVSVLANLVLGVAAVLIGYGLTLLF